MKRRQERGWFGGGVGSSLGAGGFSLHTEQRPHLLPASHGSLEALLSLRILMGNRSLQSEREQPHGEYERILTWSHHKALMITALGFEVGDKVWGLYGILHRVSAGQRRQVSTCQQGFQKVQETFRLNSDNFLLSF